MSDFAHRLNLDQVRDGDRLDLTADDAERAALASQLGLVSLDRLEAHVSLAREGKRIEATGRLKAVLKQACVATGEPVAAHIDEPFRLIFAPEPKTGADSDIELGQSELDTIFHDGQGIDLGSAIADTLALALDPYPRSAGAEAALKKAGVISEEEASPFAALAALKAKMTGGS